MLLFLQELLEKEGSGCKALLANGMLSDLSRVYRLFSRISGGLSPVADIFRQHIIDLGSEKIDQRLSRVSGSGGPAGGGAGKKGEKGEEKEKSGPQEKETSDDPQFIKVQIDHSLL